MACKTCRWWQERLGDVGWCDLRYPQEQRGLRKPGDYCPEHEPNKNATDNWVSDVFKPLPEDEAAALRDLI